MPVVYQAQSNINAVTTGDLVVTLSTHAANDILVIAVVGWVPNTNSGTNVLAAPAGGWAKASSVNTGSPIDGEWAFFWKRATSSSETNPTFTRPAQWDTGTDTVLAARCWTLRSAVRTGTPWDDIEVSAIHTAADGTWPDVNVLSSTEGRTVFAFLASADGQGQATPPSGWSYGAYGSTTTGTDAGFEIIWIDNQVANPGSQTATIPAADIAGGSGGYVFFVASFIQQSFSGTAASSFAFSSSASGIPDVIGTASSTFAISSSIVKEDIVGTTRTESTVTPDLVGVMPAAPFSSAHTVLSGTTSLIAGSGTLLTGDYGFRGLYSFTTTSAMPSDYENDSVGYVDLARFGDFALRCRRQVGTVYEVRAEFLTAAAVSTWASAFISVENDTPASVGLGVVRDSTTGTISILRSDDRWATWYEIPRSSRSFTAGALPDSVGEPITALDGDLADGAWVAVFRLQWAATDSIAAFDTNEIAAWNYGSNIVTGLGGNFYDAIDVTVKSLEERAANASYVYSMRCEATLGGKTLRSDITANVDTTATADAPTGTDGTFVFDLVQRLENGPADNVYITPVTFRVDSDFSVSVRVGDGSTSIGYGTYSFDGQRPRYRVQLVDSSGVPSYALENASVSELVWSLNEIESFNFSLPVHDPLNAEITIPDQEVQVWRGDDLLMWGVPVRSQAGVAAVDYQCRGLGWFLTKRVVGKQATNYLVNGSFETGGSWVIGAMAPTEPTAGRNPANWDAYVTTARSVKGTPGRSLYQFSNNTNVFGVRTVQFFFNEIDPADDPEGIEWTVSAWAYIPSSQWVDERRCAYTWNGDSAAMGLSIVRMSTTEFQPDTPSGITVPKVYEHKMESITKDTPKDEWVRFEVTITQPNEGSVRNDWIQVELGCPIGAVYWDEVTVTRNERLRFADVDQVTIMHSLVQHAQDPAFGKSDLNIDVAGALSGITRDRTYDFFNHDIIYDAISQFTELWKGVDWSIVVSPTTRTFRTYFPMKGTRRPAQALILGKNIGDISIPTDGEQIANRVIVMADTGSNGSAREEAYATDTSGFDSGVVLEFAYNAVKDSAISTIEDQAQRGLRQYRVPVVIPTLTTYENFGSELLGSISVGDVVPVQATIGAIELSGEYRIVQISLDPATENMQITVNPFEEWNDPTRDWGVIT